MWFAAYRKLTDPAATTRQWSWERVCRWLSVVRPYHGSKEDRKHSCPLWSPVEMLAPQRANRNVLSVHALVMDYDDDVEINDAMDAWDGFEMLAHTTWSHAPMSPRCRVVLPLASPIPAVVWSDIYREVLAEHRLPGDGQTCDQARAFYVPAAGMHDCTQVAHEEGRLLDLSPRVAPAMEAAQAREAEHRASIRERLRHHAPEFAEVGRGLRQVRELYEVDPARRETAARLVGAEVVQAGALSTWVARHALCPLCGLETVWWPLAPAHTTSVMCDHKKHCGFTMHLFDYVREFGHAAK
jgi:hypothetical protein